jgi:hypothetical protein
MKKFLTLFLLLAFALVAAPAIAGDYETTSYKTMYTSSGNYGVTATTGKFLKKIVCSRVNGATLTIVTGTALSGTSAVAGQYVPVTTSTYTFDFEKLSNGRGNYNSSGGFVVKSSLNANPVCTVYP